MENKIKVLEIMDSFYPDINGPTNVVKNYALHINRKEQCKVAVPKANKKHKYVDKEEFEVIRCISIPSFEKFMYGLPAYSNSFKKKIKEEKFDIYHAHSPFSMGRYAVTFAKKNDVPLVATMHTQFHQDFLRILKGNRFLTKIMIKYIMKLFNKADSVWTVNDASRKVLRDYGYTGEIEVVRNGTDLKYPVNAEELVQRVNQLHNLENQKNVFIFIGRIAMYKNLGLLADALKILKDDGEDFKMIFVGDGFDFEKYKKIISKNGLDDKVIFTGAIRDRELLQGYYLRSDLFLFPSTFDTSSLVPIEAAAHKLPTLLIDGSYTAENIEDNFNGFLSKETPEDFATRIKEIIADKTLMSKVGEEAHRSVYRSWEMVADEVIAKYKKIIDNYKTLSPKEKKAIRNKKLGKIDFK